MKKTVTYSPTFIEFWMDTNKKGSKESAFHAFERRLKSHGLESIKLAHRQLGSEKKNEDFKYWPDVSTFLNSLFEGCLERVPKKALQTKQERYPYWVASCAQKLKIHPSRLPSNARYLTKQQTEILEIPSRPDARNMMADIKRILACEISLRDFYERWEIPMEHRDPKHQEAAF